MSKDNNKKTPKVRFPGFDGDWEERKFGDLADYKKGPFGSAITKDMFVQKSEESIKVYEQQNAINKDWKLERYFLPKEYALTKLKSFEVHGGDIIVSCAGTIGEIYEIPENADTGIINQALMRVRVDEYCVDKKMFKIVFSNMIDDFTRVHSNGSAIKNIPPFSDLKPMGVLLPSLQEQEKISSYFENLDHLITLHQRKLEKLKEYKKGMLQKMFPKNEEKVPEVRFPGFDGEWKERKVSELCSISTGKSNTQDKVEDGKYPFYVRSPIIERSTKYLYDEEAVITVGDGVGTGKVFHYVNGKYDLHQRCYRMYGFSDELNAHYFYHTFSKLFYKRVMSMTAKTSVDSVRLEMISDMKIPVPDIEEQRKIGSFLDNLDRLIALQQKKIESLKEFKKGCLQQMFV